MGIHAKIYASHYGRDSLSVIPAEAQEVLVVNAEGPFEPKPGEQLVKLEAGPINSVRAIPINPNGSHVDGLMFGGRYIAASDSRFGELVERLLNEKVRAEDPNAPWQRFYGAVALHDRLEP